MVDPNTSFPVFANSFYLVQVGQITGKADPVRFFNGGEPSWPDIRDRIAPKRNGYWALLEVIFPELGDATCPPSIYLVTGAAGTGKTTLIKTVCYDLLSEYDASLPILFHIPNVPINPADLAPLVPEGSFKRIIVVFQNAASDSDIIERFFFECSRLKLPVTILLEERKNQWVAGRPHRTLKITPTEFELGELGDDEIEDILDALSKHEECLGTLLGKSRAEQAAHFRSLAQKDLLVALRELTSESSFDDIIKDEYEKIPSAEGQKAYLYASAFGQLDLSIRYETLQHLLRINFSDFDYSVFRPTEGILITSLAHGNSRHNFGYSVRARHPIVASIIFSIGAPDDESKFEIINDLVSRLDPGFPDDRRLLQTVIRRKELVSTFSDPDMRRGLYDRLAAILPDDPYVFQHRSILERDLKNGEAAVKYARLALRADAQNFSFKNTLGFALEFSAREAPPLLKERFTREAKKLFTEGIQRNKSDPYGYLGIAALMKQQIVDELNSVRRTGLKASLMSFLEEAYENTYEAAQIGGELAAIRMSLGDYNEAIDAIERGLKANPANSRMRDTWINIEINRGDFKKARSIAIDGIQYDPTSWRLHRAVARLNGRLCEPISAVASNYRAALRHRKGDCGLLVEFASVLFMAGESLEAAEVFAEANHAANSGQEKTRIRERWRQDNGREQHFVGKVTGINGAQGELLAVPENFRAFFWRTRDEIARLHVGDSVEFTVGFNSYGAIAHVIRKVR